MAGTLVLGATGTVGPHVVTSLLARGEIPRALTRDAARARTLLPDACEIVEGDAWNPDDVTAAADGMDAVFLLSPHAPDMADLQLRVIRTLRRSGARIVKLSGTSSAITPDGPHACRQHWEIEQILATSGQAHVVLRSNAFMQTLVDRLMLPAARDTGVVLNPLGTAGISLIDAREVGECAAVVLTNRRWDGRTLVLTGPQPVTYREIADLLAERTGRPVTVRDITPADIRRGLEQRGMAAWEAEHFEEMYRLFRAGDSQSVSGDVEELLGRPPTTVADYLARSAAEQQVESTRPEP